MWLNVVQMFFSKQNNVHVWRSIVCLDSPGINSVNVQIFGSPACSCKYSGHRKNKKACKKKLYEGLPLQVFFVLALSQLRRLS